MTTMLTEAYDALRDAQGVSEEKARKAAEAGAAYYYRFGKIEAEFAVVKCNGRIWRCGQCRYNLAIVHALTRLGCRGNLTQNGFRC